MREELRNAFPSIDDKELSSEYIEEHPDLLWDIPSIPLIKAVPLYMLWCLDNASEEDQLVFDYTVFAGTKHICSRKKFEHKMARF